MKNEGNSHRLKSLLLFGHVAPGQFIKLTGSAIGGEEGIDLGKQCVILFPQADSPGLFADRL